MRDKCSYSHSDCISLIFVAESATKANKAGLI